MDFFQKTLASKVRFSGHGLHGGSHAEITIAPAPRNTGIIFEREGGEPVKASVGNISSTELGTSIGWGPSKISTVEHLMSALAGTGIDNAHVYVRGWEIPILDGSSHLFVKAFLKAGLRHQKTPRVFLAVKEAFEWRSGDRFMRIEPAIKPSFNCSIDFAHNLIGFQSLDLSFDSTSYEGIAHARTFCHISEVETMRRAGLALGGSLDNAVVVSDGGVLNQDGLRAEDEFVRHKLLDAIGDLALLGAPLIAKVVLHKSGHGLHAQFMKELLKHKSRYLKEMTFEPSTHQTPRPQPVLVGVAAAANFK